MLLPSSKLYGFITYVRNKLFDWSVLPQHSFDIPVVTVGNLAVGGTGKTPHTEYIVEALRRTYHLAVLSRGYKRRTKGFVMATPYSKPGDIGDEAYQVYHKFDCKVTVAVCEDRVAGIRELRRLDPDLNLIVLDDGFQHRYVRPTVAIVLTEYNRPLKDDHMLPYGNLREPLSGLNRADIVVVSKCPDELKDRDYMIARKDLDLFPYQALFFSRYAYQQLQPLFADSVASVPYLDWMTERDAILAVAGIGNPRPFVRYLKSFQPRVRVNIFGDHHAFTRRDMDLLRRRYETMRGERRIIVTTEKDAVRMASSPYFPAELREVTYYLPVKVEFEHRGSEEFTDTLRRMLRRP
ncbi:MAG: tetraacyldisaccharide 4'-kinase [Bacteroides sp.]|nr:tetraacyldisaccharide 4'-kinase [Bacteroides sp.]MCM1095823.1 tetraacyldisaccharide 4'-kinase [Terasakiella sp.]